MPSPGRKRQRRRPPVLKVKIVDDIFMVQASGDVLDMLAEIAMTVSTIYTRMKNGSPQNADLFRTLFI